MTREQIRYSLIILGILDLVSFYRTYGTGFFMWAHIIATFDYGMGPETAWWDKFLILGIPVLSLTLGLLLVASGLFLIMGKKTGIIIYYFEFPLRLAFLTLTFGFIFKLFELQVGAWAYKLALTLTIGIELLRLIYSIWTHRKYYRAGQTASP